MLLRHLLPLHVDACSGVCNAGGRGTDYSTSRAGFRGPPWRADVTHMARAGRYPSRCHIKRAPGPNVTRPEPFSTGAVPDSDNGRHDKLAATVHSASRVSARHRSPRPLDTRVESGVTAGAAGRRPAGAWHPAIAGVVVRL